MTKSNVGTCALADWLEANLLFSDKNISKSDVSDLLIEEEICDDAGQDLAHLIATDGWSEISLRKRWGGTSPVLEIASNRLSFAPDWRDDISRAFFLVLSLQKSYPNWAEEHRDNSTQGELFEKIVEEICPGLLPGWDVLRAGWSPENTVSISGIVPILCEHLHTSGHPSLDEWTSDAANDGGLDIVCFRRFPDEREATPTYFLQCASGANWRDKIHTPSAITWMKYLDAAVQPSTGIAAPFVISQKDMKRSGLSGQITVFDRIRLLHAVYNEGVEISEKLATDLIAWLEPRIDALPRT